MKNVIDSTKYVVLDVETNGLSSAKHDLLSISLFKPDTQDEYIRFLPLELNSCIYTTDINGIRKKDLKNKSPLTQEEIDSLFKEYELDEREVLIYGNIDERFIKAYFKRHKLYGFDKLVFYNFKHDIISSRFSEGNVTKDNLCKLYGIHGVRKVHSGINDCKLEWNLFNAINGNKLLITGNDVYELSSDYIVPASYLTHYPNFKYFIKNYPNISCSEEEVYSLKIKNNNIKFFDSNCNGIILEHQINSMLHVKEVDSRLFLSENKNKNKFIGTLPSKIHEIQASFNDDGSLSALSDEDEDIVLEMNETAKLIRRQIEPLVTFIKENIFMGNKIYSQELIVNKDYNVLSKCDLSSEDAVLEIKFNSLPAEKFLYQLFFESNGRTCYMLHTVRYQNGSINKFVITKVNFFEKTRKIPVRRKKEPLERFSSKKRTSNPAIIILDERENKVQLMCLHCNKTWTTPAFVLKSEELICPKCFK